MPQDVLCAVLCNGNLQNIWYTKTFWKGYVNKYNNVSAVHVHLKVRLWFLIYVGPCIMNRI